MVTRVIVFLLISLPMVLKAQTGIGTTTPNASAKLDVYSTNKGFLPPRVTLTSATDATTISSPAEGLLVYNLGSVGLQAGYYYWNNANWATIATATSAGNGVTASDMVKIYDGVGNATTINSTGATFSVNTSGKYSFDFSSTASCGNCTVTLNFQVRDGANNNAVIASDMQTSYSNNVHAEYNGKVEANLITGRSYNVLVTVSSGFIASNDYCRVYMKQVSGNLPVTGQSVDYGIARYTGSDGSAMAAGALVSFDATAAGNLTWSGNKFTLKANRTYEIESGLAIYYGSGAGVAGKFQIYDYTNSSALANGLFMSQNGSGSYAESANTPMKCIVTPTTDIQVGIRLSSFYGPTTGPGIIGNTGIATTGAPNASYFIVKQLGSSAIVDPWILSGSNTYNTTGNVGIGNNAPTQALDVTGNVKTSGNYIYADGSSTVKKAAGYYNAESYLSIDNIKVACTRNGAGGNGGGLSVGAVSGSFNASISATYGMTTGTNGLSNSNITYTTTGSNSIFGWGFLTSGDGATYLINDLTNSRVYRVTLLIGSGYINNFLSIERLF